MTVPVLHGSSNSVVMLRTLFVDLVLEIVLPYSVIVIMLCFLFYGRIYWAGLRWLTFK